jgi:hypothetical protein
MWSPFKKRSAPVVESYQEPEPEKPVTGMELINKFSTPTEPKVADYPRGKYTGFWEILISDIPGGYTAVVRFYKYDTGLDQEFRFTEPTVAQLKLLVNKCIIQVMPKYER